MKHLLKNVIIVLAILASSYFFLIYILPYFIPFIIAGVLTIFIEPFVLIIQKKVRIRRGPAVGLSLFVVIGCLSAFLSLFFGKLIAELIDFSSSLPRYTEIVVNKIVMLQDQATRFYFSMPLTVLDFVANNIGSIEENVGSYINQVQTFTTGLLNSLITLISSVPGILIIIFVSFIATYFMSKDRRLLIRYWLSIIPEPWGYKILNVSRDLCGGIISYIKAQLLLTGITFVLILIGLLLVDAPYMLIISLVSAIADIIPVMGPGIIFIPWIIWVLISGNGIFAIKLTVILLVVVAVRQLLESKIVADKLGLHPLAALIAIYLGLQLIGVSGVIFGPLFLIGIKALHRAGIIQWPGS